MRIMGLDYGERTVGVAISDELLITAQGIEVIRRKEENKLRQTYARIEELCKEYGVEKIVVGFPKKLNNELLAAQDLIRFYGMSVFRLFRHIEYLIWQIQVLIRKRR